MRLFVAAETPDGLRPLLRSSAAALRAVLTSDAVRWVPEEKWHLTLCFLGERPLEDIPGLIDQALEGKTAFDLIGQGAGLFTPAVEAYGLYSPDGVSGAIYTDLALALDAYEPNRRFRPHITLARLPKTRQVVSLPEGQGTRWRFDKVSLYESRNGIYKALQTWSLKNS